MVSILVTLGFLALLAWCVLKGRFFGYLLLFIAVGFIWRLLSNLVLDVAGPLYALELGREIGGGQAVVPLVAAHVVFIVAFAVVFRPSRIRELGTVPMAEGHSAEAVLARHEKVARLVLGAFSLFVLLLFVDLGRIGVIPLFAGMERTTYTILYGGFFHGLIVKYIMHVGFVLGAFYAWGALLTGRPDNRFLLVLFCAFAYLVLVSNRFSAFYSASTFFLIPYACVALRLQFGNGRSLVASPMRPERRTRVIQVAAATVVLAVMVSALTWSLTFTRGLDRTIALANTFHRVVVIQGELWWATYERVYLRREHDPERVVNGLFRNPIAPDRNTTIPYLMELEIGEDVYPILEAGSAYTGGYPEIVFEWWGPSWGFLGVFTMAFILARFQLALLRALERVRYVRSFLVFYVMFPFMLFMAGGMLNVFTSWRFWAKASVLLLWVLYEEWRRLRPQQALGEGVVSAEAPA